MTRITLRFIEKHDLGNDMDNVNKVFFQLGKRIYSFMIGGNPWMDRAMNRGYEEFN